MIVELIGCAGAGKTTLRGMLCERGIAGRRARPMADLVLGRRLLRRVTHPTAANVAQEIASVPFLVGGRRDDRVFLRYAWRTLTDHARTTFDRLNGIRGIARKVGMYRLAETRARDEIVVSDEGTLLSAYNLLVLTDLDLEPLAVDRFLRLVPLPDRAVYVRAPIPTLVARAHSRPAPRRQHRGRAASEVERDVLEAVELFDLMAASPVLANRLLVVDNDDGDEASRRRTADRIAAWLEGSLEAANARPLLAAGRGA